MTFITTIFFILILFVNSYSQLNNQDTAILRTTYVNRYTKQSTHNIKEQKNGKFIISSDYPNNNKKLRAEVCPILIIDTTITLMNAQKTSPNKYYEIIEAIHRDTFIFCGKYESWHENGNKHIITNYNSSSFPIGVFLEFYPNRKLKRKSYYISESRDHISTILDSTYQEYHENGAISIEGTYNKGLKNGIWKCFSNENTPINVAQYKNDFLDGKYQEYYPSGKLKTMGTYCIVKKEKVWKMDWDTLVEHEELVFSSQKDGIWQYYAEDGTLVRAEKYNLGDLVE